jgi:hypothetical protein
MQQLKLDVKAFTSNGTKVPWTTEVQQPAKRALLTIPVKSATSLHP